MSEQFRTKDNYYPFAIAIDVIPMLFIWDLSKETLVVEIKSYLDKSDFETDRNSAFDVLSDKLALQGSIYEAIISNPAFQVNFDLLKTTARQVADFQANDNLLKIRIDSEETIVEISGERILGENQVDLEGDPSRIFGASQNKFELLKLAFPELTQSYYLLVLGIFATIKSPRQRFYKRILDNKLAELSN